MMPYLFVALTHARTEPVWTPQILTRACVRQATILWSLVARVVASCAFTPLGGHALWKFHDIYITLCPQVDKVYESFRYGLISDTLDSDIVFSSVLVFNIEVFHIIFFFVNKVPEKGSFSGGHALWNYYRHLFHSQISSGHQP